MKQMHKVIRELNTTLGRVDIFLVLLKTLVLLTVSYTFLYLLRLETFYAFIPAMAYFTSSFIIESRFDQLERVEKRYPELKEKLITARDYKDKESIVLDTLEADIVASLKSVELSSFFPSHKVLMLIFLLVLSVTASLYMVSKDMKILDVNDFIENARKQFEKEQQLLAQEDFTGTEESIMEVGSEKISVEINPVGLDLDLNEESEIPEHEFTSGFPEDVFLSSGASYDNEFTEEQQALIKRYFQNKNG